MGDVDAVEVVRRFGGTARWTEILRHTTGHSLRQALATRSLVRVSRGIYSLPEVPSVRQAAAAMRGLVSHRSAADHWLMERLTSEAVSEIVLPRHARPSPRKGVITHFADVPAEDDAGGVTSPLRTVVDCALSLPYADALAIADSALRRDLISHEQLLRAAEGRRGRGRAKVVKVAHTANHRAANPFESALRAIVFDAGLRGFAPQVPVRAKGLLAWVDLGDAESRIALEADSFEFHGTRSALARDCRRYDELVRGDWLVLRFAWEDVMFDQAWVAEVVLDTWELRKRTRQRSA